MPIQSLNSNSLPGSVMNQVTDQETKLVFYNENETSNFYKNPIKNLDEKIKPLDVGKVRNIAIYAILLIGAIVGVALTAIAFPPSMPLAVSIFLSVGMFSLFLIFFAGSLLNVCAKRKALQAIDFDRNYNNHIEIVREVLKEAINKDNNLDFSEKAMDNRRNKCLKLRREVRDNPNQDNSSKLEEMEFLKLSVNPVAYTISKIKKKYEGLEAEEKNSFYGKSLLVSLVVFKVLEFRSSDNKILMATSSFNFIEIRKEDDQDVLEIKPRVKCQQYDSIKVLLDTQSIEHILDGDLKDLTQLTSGKLGKLQDTSITDVHSNENITTRAFK